MQLEVWPGLAIQVVKPFVGIKDGVAVEIIKVAMKSIAAGFGCHHHIGAAIASEFSRRIQRYCAEFLHVVRIEPLNVALRVRHRGFIRINAVNGHVVCAVAGTEDVGSRPCGRCSPLHYTGLQGQQAQRIASIQGQFFDLQWRHHVAHRGIGGFNALIRALYFHHLLGGAYF